MMFIHITFALYIIILQHVYSFRCKPVYIQRVRENMNIHPLYNPRGTGRILRTANQLNLQTDNTVDTYEKLRLTLKGTCVYLVGMMGSGKSTVGAILAKKMGYRFLDTDELAEYMIEMPIAEFFEKEGESAFRDVEHTVLLQTAQYVRVIVSTGGGIVMKNENWGFMRHGIVCFLDVSPQQIYARLMRDPEQLSKRPLLAAADPLAQLTSLLEERKEKYSMADVRVPVDDDESVTEKSDTHNGILDSKQAQQEAAEATAATVAAAILQQIAEHPARWVTWNQKREEQAINNAKRTSAAAAKFIKEAQVYPLHLILLMLKYFLNNIF